MVKTKIQDRHRMQKAYHSSINASGAGLGAEGSRIGKGTRKVSQANNDVKQQAVSGRTLRHNGESQDASSQDAGGKNEDLSQFIKPLKHELSATHVQKHENRLLKNPSVKKGMMKIRKSQRNVG
jgi:hypothetical protein